MQAPVTQPSEPVFNVPSAVVGLVAVLLLVHAFGGWLLGEGWIIWELAFIPGRFGSFFGVDIVALAEAGLRTDEEGADQLLALARAIAADGESKPWTFLTYAFLHGSWPHVLLNCVWLTAFGTAVARRFGALRFLVLMVLAAVGGSVGHLVTQPGAVLPMVGASAAVSGAMAAALRFAFQPGAPLGIYRLDERSAYLLPALPLRDVLAERRALAFVVIWFVLNLASGLAAPELGLVDSSIAWQAHIGGFLVGLLTFPLLDPVPRGPGN